MLINRRVRSAAYILVTLLVLVVGAELLGRTLGLGDRPLYESDPQIEYLLQPSRTYHPFHHLVHINAYSMRSDDFPIHKSRSDEFRVLVIGDSVVYDGTQIDQHDICTEVMKRFLEKNGKKRVVVGNISAQSWGPPNQLAYIKRFGLFDADAVVYVLSSDDSFDTPTFKTVVEDHRPVLPAIHDALILYLPRYVRVPWALSRRGGVILVECHAIDIAVTDFQKRSSPSACGCTLTSPEPARSRIGDGLSRDPVELRDDPPLVRYILSFLRSQTETNTTQARRQMVLGRSVLKDQWSAILSLACSQPTGYRH
jgi:hypothetical protein